MKSVIPHWLSEFFSLSESRYDVEAMTKFVVTYYYLITTIIDTRSTAVIQFYVTNQFTELWSEVTIALKIAWKRQFGDRASHKVTFVHLWERLCQPSTSPISLWIICQTFHKLSTIFADRTSPSEMGRDRANFSAWELNLPANTATHRARIPQLLSPRHLDDQRPGTGSQSEVWWFSWWKQTESFRALHTQANVVWGMERLEGPVPFSALRYRSWSGGSGSATMDAGVWPA